MSLTMYLDTHNAYVQQLQATNAMLEAYHSDTLPQLLQELEDIYNDLCTTVSDAVIQSAEVISGKVSPIVMNGSANSLIVCGRELPTTFPRLCNLFSRSLYTSKLNLLICRRPLTRRNATRASQTNRRPSPVPVIWVTLCACCRCHRFPAWCRSACLRRHRAWKAPARPKRIRILT